MKTKTQRYNDYQRKLTRLHGKHRLCASARSLADCLGVTRIELMAEFQKVTKEISQNFVGNTIDKM